MTRYFEIILYDIFRRTNCKNLPTIGLKLIKYKPEKFSYTCLQWGY